jgi:large subunit ribosomal protein L18
MVKGRKQIVPHRRRRELKTDYKKRLMLLKSGKPRLVVRKSLNSIICEVVEYVQKGDRCLVYANSGELKKYGWKLNTGNIPASYLTGLLCAIRAKKKGVGEAILDLGLYTSTKGSRLYAALKGAVDGGLEVPHSEEILPGEDRMKGAHIAAYAEWMKRESANDYRKRFSAYLKAKVEPEKLPAHFEEVREKIMKA